MYIEQYTNVGKYEYVKQLKHVYILIFNLFY